MSAQFLEVYEIGSSVPMSKELKEEKKEKDPLNLTLEISESKVSVSTGVRNKTSKVFALSEKTELKKYLVDLKVKNPKENTMILKVAPKISFQDMVKVIDSTQANDTSKDKLFSQIVFDNNGIRK